MQPDFFRGEVEAGCKLLKVRVEPLGSDEQVDAAVRRRRGEPGFGAEGGLVQHAVAAQVAGVLELTLHLGDAVDPAYGLADPAFSTDLDAHWICTPPTPTLPRKGGGRCFKVTRWPSRTTGFPSTKRCRTGPELQNTSAATGSDSAPRWARSSMAKRAMSARFPTFMEPMSSRPRHAAPPRVATRRAWRAVMAAAPFRALVVSKAWRVSASRLPLSFEAEPSTARPTATPASMSSRAGANPEPSRIFDVGHQATAVRVEAMRLISAGARCTQWASQTSAPRNSRSSRSSSGRRLKVLRQYASSSSVSAMCVCSRTLRRRASAADSRISRSDTEKGEQGPTAIRSIDPGAGSWKRPMASAVAERIRSTHSTTESGGRPA